MILFDRGAFKLDDPVANALPELAKVRVKAGHAFMQAPGLIEG